MQYHHSGIPAGFVWLKTQNSKYVLDFALAEPWPIQNEKHYLRLKMKHSPLLGPTKTLVEFDQPKGEDSIAQRLLRSCASRVSESVYMRVTSDFFPTLLKSH